MKARILCVSAVCAAISLALPVQAKSLSRIIAEMGLSPADFEVVSATSDAMLAGGAPRVGQEESWINDETGSKGTIRVQAVQDNCVSLQHFVDPAGADGTREIRTRRCQDASGKWILTP